jgi:hypothetical protein
MDYFILSCLLSNRIAPVQYYIRISEASSSLKQDLRCIYKLAGSLLVAWDWILGFKFQDVSIYIRGSEIFLPVDYFRGMFPT